MKAGEIVGHIYEALLEQYDDNSPEALRWLNILCVRIVFCLYAEDAGIFGRDQFHNYLIRYEAMDMRNALIRLFEVLNTPEDKRSRYLMDDLKAFPYTNGGLFAEQIDIPQFTDELRQTLLQNASLDFDWSEISPTIFGAVFESTLNPETRRAGGMHYTSIENIHKVIDPLFLSDPACGSGNFLTETYLSLRRLENEVIRERHHGQSFLGFEEVNPIKVSINQFYGIEINDFAVTVATTALWISEAQMLAETERIIHQDINFLPLKAYSNIVEGNALQVDWGEVVHPDYIVGNPPFVGKSFQTDEQKADMKQVFDGVKNYGNLDYVASWYKKCADLMEGTRCKAALVSTNSVCQGIAVPPLWSHLLERGVKINFAYPSFKWKSESNDGAAVHCVIVGFSFYDTKDKFIMYEGKAPVRASNINPYLLDAPSVIIDDRHDPICDVPKSAVGSFPTDGGNLVIQADELDDFIKQEPAAEKFIRPFIGPLEFINAKKRYCLWLKDCTPQELRTMPLVKIRQPETNYILFPRTSSERRRYLPIGFLPAEVIAGDTIILPNATLYHFGVLTSNVHNAWMRVVCGRMKSDYRYSSTLVYNNLPWPSPTEAQREKIEQTAQAVLDARALYPESSLADLYDEVTMPPELRKAHQANDRAVMEAYGWKASSQFTESMCVAELFKLYQNLTEKI